LLGFAEKASLIHGLDFDGALYQKFCKDVHSHFITSESY